MPYPVVVTIIIKLKRTFPQGSYSVFLLSQPRLIQLCLQEVDLLPAFTTWFFAWHGPLNWREFQRAAGTSKAQGSKAKDALGASPQVFSPQWLSVGVG